VQVVQAAAAGLLRAPVMAGTNIYFNELNRHRLPPGRAAGLAWSVNPQVHAFDELSLVENLQAQGDTVATARSFAPDARLFVTPVTLRPRFNAVASTDEEFRPGELPWEVDARQVSLFAAAWTLGSAAGLARAGIDALTYYDTVGSRGVIEGPAGSAYPGAFRSSPDTAYPLALVLADLCALRGARLHEVRGADPAGLTALAAGLQGGITLLLGNLTREPRTVSISWPAGAASAGAATGAVGAGAVGRLRMLDARTCRAATSDPEAFLRSGDLLAMTGNPVQLTLHPYAVARWDLMR
jgi:hypothetical protein